MEVAKALGGSFNLVTPAPKPVREMTQLPSEKQKLHMNKLRQYKHTKYKPRLNTHTKNTLGPTGLYELVLVAVHMEKFQCTN